MILSSKSAMHEVYSVEQHVWLPHGRVGPCSRQLAAFGNIAPDVGNSSLGTFVRRPVRVNFRALHVALYGLGVSCLKRSLAVIDETIGPRHRVALAPHFDANAGNRQELR